jgi:hypothetical protein
MKKLLFTLIILGGITACCFGQEVSTAPPKPSNDGVKFNIGAEAGLPLGEISNIYSFVIGGSVKVEIPTFNRTYLTLSAGYNSWMVKSDLKDLFGSSTGFVPLKAGIKYYADSNFFLEGQAGIVFSTETDGGHAFVFSPGIGYTFNGGFEAGLRYEGWNNEGTTSQLGLRLAYRF